MGKQVARGARRQEFELRDNFGGENCSNMHGQREIVVSHRRQAKPKVGKSIAIQGTRISTSKLLLRRLQRLCAMCAARILELETV